MSDKTTNIEIPVEQADPSIRLIIAKDHGGESEFVWAPWPGVTPEEKERALEQALASMTPEELATWGKPIRPEFFSKIVIGEEG